MDAAGVTARPTLHMRLELTGRHIRITPSLRQLVQDGLEKLERVLHDGAVSMQAVLSQEKHRHHVEMTLHARGEHFFHGAATGRDLAAALGGAAEKLEHQVQKLKSKWTERKRQGVSPARADSLAVALERPAARTVAARRSADGEVRIIRTRRYAVKPMSVDEAALEVGASGGAFIVFRNAFTDTVNVLFRRPDGNLGLIEPEA